MEELIKKTVIGFIGTTLILTIGYFVGNFVCNYRIFGTMKTLSNPELIMLGLLSLILCVFAVVIMYLIGEIFSRLIKLTQ